MPYGMAISRPKNAIRYGDLKARKRIRYGDLKLDESEAKKMGFLKDKKTSQSQSPSPSPTSTSPCSDLRTTYHNCFNRWFSEKFVKGQWQKEECVAEWEKYRTCLSQHLDDKQLSRFLEAEASGIPSVDRSDTKSSVDDASMGGAK